MRVTAFASTEYGSFHYRAYLPLMELGRRGHEVHLNIRDDAVGHDLAGFDVAYVHRYQDRRAQRLARRLREAGLAVVWDNDDNVSDTTEMRRDAMRAQEAASGVRAMVGIADVVTTTTATLAQLYREQGAGCVRVIENYLPEAYADVRRPAHDGVVLGWIAWMDHQEDWDRMGLQPVVARLLETHPELVVESVGPIDLGLDRKRYRRTGAVGFDELPARVANFDVGIAPLRDVPFNRARSNVKAKEYAASGVAWLASPIGPYEGMGDKQGGRLVADDRWSEEISTLVENARLRRKLAKRGAKWAAGQLLSRNGDAWELALQEAIERRRAG